MAFAAIASAASGVAGGLAGSILNYNATNRAQKHGENAARNAANSISNSWNASKGAYDSAASNIDDYGNTVTAAYGDDTAIGNAGTQYQQAANKQSDTYKADDFSYDGGVNDFYDKAWQTNNDAQNSALERSAASSGNLYASNTAGNIAKNTSANANRAYKEAMEAYQSDYSNKVNAYNAEQSAAQQEGSQNITADQNRTSNLANYLSSATSASSDVNTAKANNTLAKANAYQSTASEYASQLANAGGKKANSLSY